MSGEDRDYVARVHDLPCLAALMSPCDGPIVAHHAGRRGLSQRAHDRTCVPLCDYHHRSFHNASGPWKAMRQGERREWMTKAVAATIAILDPDTDLAGNPVPF